MYLHEDKELFQDVLNNTHEATNLPVKMIEKDYYVTAILKLLSEKADNVVFKGGTSLSKCYHAIDRFSEDIDITFTEHIGANKRKHLKYDILKVISEELNMPIGNWDKIQSDRDYNCYYFEYESIEKNEIDEMLPSVKLETALSSYSFPVNKMSIDSYVYQYLKQENQEIIDEFNLQLFEMNVQSIERTFIDKVFALCDYYMQGKSHRYSRHLYDLVKLRTFIRFDTNFAELVKKVREHRREMSICPSAKDGIDIPTLIKEFCENDFYKKDYEEITYYFMNSPLDYSKTIINILEISNSGLF